MYSKRAYDLNCRLCVEINDFDLSEFSKEYPDIVKQNTFLETQRLQAMIPYGPFCEGHLLIVSKTHMWSFGHLGEDIIPELSQLINDVTSFVEARYGRTIVFEHGPMSRTQPGGCCLEHAHINVMPIPDSFQLFESTSKHVTLEPTELHQLKDFAKRAEPYLFFMCPREGSFAAKATDVPSQFFRRLLAASSSGRTWDWRTNPNSEAVEAIASFLSELSNRSPHEIR